MRCRRFGPAVGGALPLLTHEPWLDAIGGSAATTAFVVGVFGTAAFSTAAYFGTGILGCDTAMLGWAAASPL